MTEIYFVDGFSYARVISGLALYSLLIVAISKWRSHWRNYLAMALIILTLSLTYYAATIISVLMFSATLIVAFIFSRRDVPRVVTALVLLLIIAPLVYNMVYTEDSGGQEVAAVPVEITKTIAIDTATQVSGQTATVHDRQMSVLDWSCREHTIQQVFGKGLMDSDVDYKINLLMVWLKIISTVTLLLLSVLFIKDWLTILGTTHLLLILAAIIIPSLSLIWGIMRFWLYSSTIMLVSGVRVMNDDL